MPPPAKYRCMKCGLKWSGCRFMPDEFGVLHKESGYGMTECPSPTCRSIYVEWVNWQKCLNALGRYLEHD